MLLIIQLYNMSRMVSESTTGTDALNRWVTNTNENTDIPREGYYASTYGSYVNSRFVEDAILYSFEKRFNWIYYS